MSQRRLCFQRDKLAYPAIVTAVLAIVSLLVSHSAAVQAVDLRTVHDTLKARIPGAGVNFGTLPPFFSILESFDCRLASFILSHSALLCFSSFIRVAFP